MALLHDSRALFSLAALLLTPSVLAETVDTLADAHAPLTTDADAVVSANLGTILGGERDAELTVTGAGGSFEIAAGGPITLASAAGTSTATAEIAWDGVDGDATSLDAIGLGGVDLTAGGHDALSFILEQATAGAVMELEVHTDGASASRYRWILPAVASPIPALVPYANFQSVAGAGASFSSAGAIVLRLLAADGAEIRLGGPIQTATAAPLIQASQLALDQPGLSGGVEIGAEPVNPGGTFTYRVTLRNTGEAATGVTLSNLLDGNLSQAGAIRATPITSPDHYIGCGNVTLVADGSSAARAGLLANDQSIDGDLLTVVAILSPTALGGTVALDDAATGRFTYHPPVGVLGTDTFSYTVQDAEGHQVTGQASVALAQRVWFVDSSSAGADLGTQANPFHDLSELDGGADVDAPGDTLVLIEAGAAYGGGLPLEDGQHLLGGNSSLLPCDLAGAGARPTLTQATGDTLELAAGNLIDSVDVTSSDGAGVAGNDFGAATFGNLSVTSVGGPALALVNGSPRGTLESLSSTGSPTVGLLLDDLDAASDLTVSGPSTVDNAGGVGIEIRTTAAGASLTFGDAAVMNRNASGIELSDHDGSLVLADVDIPNPNAAAGHGLRISSSGGDVELASLDVSGTVQSVARLDANADGIPDNTNDDGHAITRLSHTGSFTVTGTGTQGDGGTLENLGGDGVRMHASGDLALSSVTINNIGTANGAPATIDDAGIFAFNATGNLHLTDSTLSRFETGAGGNDRGINLTQNGVSFTELRVTDTTFFNSGPGVAGDDAILVTARGTVNGSVVVTSDVAVGDPAHRSVFHTLSGEGVQVNHNGAGTFTVTVSNSQFRDAVTPGGFGGLSLGAAGSATMDSIVSNNVLSALYDLGVNNGGMITLFAGGTADFSAMVSGNDLDTSDGRGGIRAVTGDAASDDVVDFDITIDGNTIDDVDREAITIDLRGPALQDSGETASIRLLNNRIGEDVAPPTSGREGIEIRNRGATAARVMNLLMQGNAITSFANSSGDETVDIDAEDFGVINATILGNTFAQNGNSADSLDLDVEDGTANICLDLNGDDVVADRNTADRLIFLDAGTGTFTVEDLGVNDPETFLEANNPGTNVSVSGTLSDHGGDCPVP